MHISLLLSLCDKRAHCSQADWEKIKRRKSVENHMNSILTIGTNSNEPQWDSEEEKQKADGKKWWHRIAKRITTDKITKEK